MKNSLIFALTIIGTVIGAGFATGQELFSFFVLKSHSGYLYYIISSVVLTATAFFVYIYSWKNKIYSQDSLFNVLFGYKTSIVINLISSLFLFSCFVITASATGTLFYENIKWPYFTGILTVIVTTYAVIQFDIGGIYFLNAVLTPVIIICILLSGIAASFVDISASVILSLKEKISPLLFAFLYFGYNIFSVIPIVLKSARENTFRDMKKGFIVSLIIILIMGITIIYTLYSNSFLANSFKLPFLGIIAEKSLVLGNIYIIIMYFAMLTTAASCFYGFCSNMTDLLCINNNIVSCGGLLIAYFLSFIGFCDLVRNVYSFFGYLGILISICTIVKIFIKVIKN